MIPLGEAHLQAILREYAAHHHLEQDHQRLDHALIEERASPAHTNGSPSAPSSLKVAAIHLDTPRTARRMVGLSV